jgi:hypothetical protein
VNLEEAFRHIHPNSANLFHRRSLFGEIGNELNLAHAMPSGAVHPITPINIESPLGTFNIVAAVYPSPFPRRNPWTGSSSSPSAVK